MAGDGMSWLIHYVLIGLGLLSAVVAITLVIAGWTRWGQHRPLSKCIALAVLAHVWLLMIAYSTRVRQREIGSHDGHANGQAAFAVALDQLVVEADQPFVAPEMLPSAPSLLPAAESALDDEQDQRKMAIEERSIESSAALDEEIAASILEHASKSPSRSSGDQTSAPMTSDEDTAAIVTQPKSNQIVAVDDTVKVATELPVENSSDGPSPASQTPSLEPQSTPTTSNSRIPELYRNRFAENRLSAVARFGADETTEAAVDRALAWLAQVQEEDGSWNALRHGAGQETRTLQLDRGGTGSKADAGLTGLALLAFLGSGHTHVHGNYSGVVSKGLSYLIAYQQSSGDLSGPKQIGHGTDVMYARMYCHGMALLAISEAFAMTDDQALVDAIQRGAAFTLRAQNPQSGGWRYHVMFTGDPGDMSQFGWQAMALTSSRHAGVVLTPELRSRLQRFLDSVKAGSYGGLAVYRPIPGQAPSASMTAEALALRKLLDLPMNVEAENEAVRSLLANLPGSGEENLYLWYYATMALFQRQDSAWATWNEAMKRTLCASQHLSGTATGSWEPRCIWAGYGGRIYSTALSCLCLEVYYRYLPLYQADASNGPSLHAADARLHPATR